MSTKIKPKILYLVHSYYKGAGTEHHLRNLVEGFKEQFEVTVVVPNEGKIYALRDDAALLVYDCKEAAFPLTPKDDPELSAVLGNILNKVTPDLIHIHHIARWPLSVIDQLQAEGKPLLMSFHDYYVITPLFTMQGVDDPRDTVSSDYAIRALQSDESKYLTERREILSRSLAKLTKRIVPSKFMASELSKVFLGEYTVIEHGIEPFQVLPKRKSENLRFGYLGNLLPQKGWEYLVRAFNEVRKKHSNIELYLFGGVQKFPSRQDQGIYSHGYYEKRDLPKILSQFDIGIVPSIFKEPYCFTLSELWHAGIPVGVSDIGALSERVSAGVNGIKFKAEDVNSLIAALQWFLQCDDWRNWILAKPKLIAEMLKDYETLYTSLLTSKVVVA